MSAGEFIAGAFWGAFVALCCYGIYCDIRRARQNRRARKRGNDAAERGQALREARNEVADLLMIAQLEEIRKLPEVR